MIGNSGDRQPTEPHGWMGTETLNTRFGDFKFEGGYAVGDVTQQLLDLQKLNRAVEVYSTQLMAVSEIAVKEGLRAFGATKPTQVVVWENLMDSGTILLTANTETVYAIAHLDLMTDGPTVIEAPPRMLGFIQDGLQRYLADIGPLGPDKGKGEGSSWFLPVWLQRKPARRIFFVSQSPTYSVLFTVRRISSRGQDGSSGRSDEADQDLSLSPETSSPPPMEFLNGSGKQIDTLFPDNFHYFELLAKLVGEEPRDVFGPLERFQMQSIGIEKGQPFQPDDKTKALLSEAARLGGAIARANTFGPPKAYYYPDRKWQGVPEGMTYKFTRDDALRRSVPGTASTIWRLGNSLP